MFSKHIIVEGMDGTGKSGLVANLCAMLGMDLHERACTSDGGPVQDLAAWVRDDTNLMEADKLPPSIYDRHPLISEPIYGNIIRGGRIAPMFNNRMWVANQMQVVARHAVVIWCMPPMETVLANLYATNQMSGVVEHAYGLYSWYKERAGTWPGAQCVHDYTRNTLDSVVNWARVQTTTNIPWIED